MGPIGWSHGRACFCKFKLIASKSKETGARGTEIFWDTLTDSDRASWPAHRLLNGPNKQSVRWPLDCLSHPRYYQGKVREDRMSNS